MVININILSGSIEHDKRRKINNENFTRYQSSRWDSEIPDIKPSQPTFNKEDETPVFQVCIL